eukprot:1444920-Amphidinium_carterae.1
MASLRREGRLYFGTDLILMLDGNRVRTVCLGEEDLPTECFSLLDIGLCYGPGCVSVSLRAEDCCAPWQTCKSGLVIDRLVACPC